ncbi:MAG: sensor protein [Pseudonocardia sp.]|uniref:DICT sensory domain-containing protein n=1 Tax=unclassified Pseudonocardia TaxID=2619320 RepID=UPI001AC01E50|nr:MULTISPECIES: DICT sensory domain-containing protein [unclassified Pseudonocardia]MBN9107658.1 sensor protein [Pseudonocardia sp.]
MTVQSGFTSGIHTKRVLVDVSHAIEHYALAAGPPEQTMVVAMFQRLSYFLREVEVYRRIAARGVRTVVGIVEDLPPALPPGIDHVLLRDDERLAREWSVTVLSPGSGATLVATDLETVSADATTLESGRQFRGGWSFLREDAYAQAMRLRHALGPRLHPTTADGLDDVLRTVTTTPVREEERPADAALHHLAQRLSGRLADVASLRVRLDAAPGGSGVRDPRSGLPAAAYLDGWLRGAGSGTLPLGLLLVRVHEIAAVRAEFGVRAELAALQLVGERLRSRLSGPDRAVSLGSGDFLLLLPTRGGGELDHLYKAVAHDLGAARERYPFVPLRSSGAATVTRGRPLPLPQLLRAVGASRLPEPVRIGA